MTWPTKRLGDVLEKIPQIKGIKTNLYHKEGKYPIIDQGQSFIAGYSDNALAVYKGHLPVVVFGDHTRAIKFLEYPFALGADGTKILLPKKEYDGKFFYFSLLNLDIKSRGYARHYKLLREKEISLPPLEIQRKVVKKIEELFAKISQAQPLRESAIQDTNNLIPATLSKIFEKGRLKGWKEKKLSEVVKIIGGGTPSKNNFSYYKGNIPWATVRDLKSDYIVDTEFKISEQAVKESSTNIIPANNVILVTRVGLGKISIITKDTAINQDLKALIPRDASGLDKIFLFWWLKTQMKFIQSQGRGATVMGVRLELINNLTTPLPPISEQKEIVERMDALTQKVRELQKLQSETATNLTALKQSILHQAFEGRLIN